MKLNGPPHMAVQKQDDQHKHTFSSYVRIRDVVLKTYLVRWTIGRSGKRGSGISVLPARHDDDDEIKLSYKALRLFMVFLKQTWLGWRLVRIGWSRGGCLFVTASEIRSYTRTRSLSLPRVYVGLQESETIWIKTFSYSEWQSRIIIF